MSKRVGMVEEEEAEMVSPAGDCLAFRRLARFLRPRAGSASSAVAVPPVPLLCEAVSRGLVHWPPKKILFKGWRHPQPKWAQWIEKLKPLYRNLWKKAGISDAITASTYEVRRDPAVLFGLLVYWSHATNTFVLPWSEVGLTLEDVVVLGGCPLVGEPVRTTDSPTPEFETAIATMATEHKAFRRRSSRKPFHYDWLNYYMEQGKGDHLEHVAFISLWLSRYVFPAPPFDVVGRHVFPLAIRLAQGTKIALAPAVLASIYRDMRFLWEYGISNRAASSEMNPPVAWAPFQILQLWAWERFIALRPDGRPNFLQWDEPRAARWHCLDGRLKLPAVMSALESEGDFLWRPYAAYLDDWCPPSFYKDESQWVIIHPHRIKKDGDDSMVSLVHCLRACELVGLDSIEQYCPHRVAMQFGLDQDWPGNVPRCNTTWESAWATYNKIDEENELYVPPRLFESDVTLKFLNWQRQCMKARNALWQDKRM